MADKINMHSLVLMHYSLALTDGTEIESSLNDEPVEIAMGNDDVTEGMELALFGLKEGDTQTLTLTAEQGFGIRDEDNIHDMPLTDFPEDLAPEVGLSYSDPLQRLGNPPRLTPATHRVVGRIAPHSTTDRRPT